MGSEPWRVAFRRAHGCHAAVRGREGSLHIDADGLPRSANLSWYPRTVAEAVFERDSVRREFERQGGRLCLERRDSTVTIQVWTVGSVRAVIGLDTLRARGPAIHVFGVDSTLSPCTPARIGLN